MPVTRPFRFGGGAGATETATETSPSTPGGWRISATTRC